MTRLQLDAVLRTLSDHVYFQPPPNLQLEYDCIVYDLDDIYIGHADNVKYISKKRYEVTLITKKFDEAKIDEIMNTFDHIDYSRPFKSDNLYHNVFFIYI